ncbi:MAG: class I SAM-dependent methyltransferase, partial [Alphaproteobacteria bacterium]
YYRRADPLGAAGDFTTAPEISQMFGEMIGLWCAEMWQRMGRPAPAILAELGPGRGTLMADLLRAARMAPGFPAALRLHLVETSPALRARQRAALPGLDVVWHDRVESVPDGPLLLVANEFFDALPVHQFVCTPRGWRERLVAVGADGRFGLVLAAAPTPMAALIAPALRDSAAEGAVAEVSPASIAAAAAIGRRIAAQGGAALILDYGDAQGRGGDTLQAVRRHARHDPFDAPGSADLTAHVDFARLAQAASEGGARCHGPVSQGAFLERLGIRLRADRLRPAAVPGSVDAALDRLIGPAGMGTLFKALAVVHPDLGPPPAFEQPDAMDSA